MAISLINGCANSVNESTPIESQTPAKEPTPIIVEEQPESTPIIVEEQPKKEIIAVDSKPVKEPEEPTQEAVKEFAITAKRFEFNPSTITVNKGDKVKLTITSTDTTHGFSLPDFNINERLEPNQPVTVEFVADKLGTFTFRCNIRCGSGHSTMSGTLIVK